MKKKLTGLIVIGIILVGMVTMTIPVSAYTCTSVHYGVQLRMQSYSDAWCLAMFPSYAADVVLYIANRDGIPNQRSKGNIEGEIRFHALMYLRWGDGEPQNPMSIVLAEPDWWPYHLMD